MDSEQRRFIGISVAHVDYVFSDKNQTYPTAREQVLPFIEAHKPNLIRAGGSLPNTFAAVHLLTRKRLKLFHCVGADERGDFFRRETSPEVGLAQVHPTEPTGVWVGFSDGSGSLRFGLTYYGAALKVRATKDDLEEEPNGIFITDISSSKNQDIHSQTDTILRQIDQEGGLFVLSLGGARPSSLNQSRLSSIINSFRNQPQIVFSNIEEFKYVTQADNIEQAMLSCFPSARLLVVTLGNEGSILRYEDLLMKVSAIQVNEVKDVVGA